MRDKCVKQDSGKDKEGRDVESKGMGLRGEDGNRLNGQTSTNVFMEATEQTWDEGNEKEKRRMIHNNSEKKRKDKIRCGINKISSLLPADYHITPREKETAVQVLEKTAEFITVMTVERETYMVDGGRELQGKEISKLREENERLLFDNQRLKRILENAGVPYDIDPEEVTKHWKGNKSANHRIAAADSVNDGSPSASHQSPMSDMGNNNRNVADSTNAIVDDVQQTSPDSANNGTTDGGAGADCRMKSPTRNKVKRSPTVSQRLAERDAQRQGPSQVQDIMAEGFDSPLEAEQESNVSDKNNLVSDTGSLAMTNTEDMNNVPLMTGLPLSVGMPLPALNPAMFLGQNQVPGLSPTMLASGQAFRGIPPMTQTGTLPFMPAMTQAGPLPFMPSMTQSGTLPFMPMLVPSSESQTNINNIQSISGCRSNNANNSLAYTSCSSPAVSSTQSLVGGDNKPLGQSSTVAAPVSHTVINQPNSTTNVTQSLDLKAPIMSTNQNNCIFPSVQNNGFSGLGSDNKLPRVLNQGVGSLQGTLVLNPASGQLMLLPTPQQTPGQGNNSPLLGGPAGLANTTVRPHGPLLASNGAPQLGMPGGVMSSCSTSISGGAVPFQPPGSVNPVLQGTNLFTVPPQPVANDLQTSNQQGLLSGGIQPVRFVGQPPVTNMVSSHTFSVNTPQGVVTMDTTPSMQNQLPSALLLPNGTIVPVVTQPSALYGQQCTPVNGGLLMASGNKSASVAKPATPGILGANVQARMGAPVVQPAKSTVESQQANALTMESNISTGPALPNSVPIPNTIPIPSVVNNPTNNMNGAFGAQQSVIQSMLPRQPGHVLAQRPPPNMAMMPSIPSAQVGLATANVRSMGLAGNPTNTATQLNQIPVQPKGQGIGSQATNNILAPGLTLGQKGNQTATATSVTEPNSPRVLTPLQVAPPSSGGAPVVSSSGKLASLPQTVAAFLTSDGKIILTLPNNNPNGAANINQGPGQPLSMTQTKKGALQQRTLMPKMLSTGAIGQPLVANLPITAHSQVASPSPQTQTTVAASSAPGITPFTPLSVSVSDSASQATAETGITTNAPSAGTTDILAQAAESIFSSSPHDVSPTLSNFYNPAHDDNPLHIDTGASEAETPKDGAPKETAMAAPVKPKPKPRSRPSKKKTKQTDGMPVNASTTSDKTDRPHSNLHMSSPAANQMLEHLGDEKLEEEEESDIADFSDLIKMHDPQTSNDTGSDPNQAPPQEPTNEIPSENRSVENTDVIGPPSVSAASSVEETGNKATVTYTTSAAPVSVCQPTILTPDFPNSASPQTVPNSSESTVKCNSSTSQVQPQTPSQLALLSPKSSNNDNVQEYPVSAVENSFATRSAVPVMETNYTPRVPSGHGKLYPEPELTSPPPLPNSLSPLAPTPPGLQPSNKSQLSREDNFHSQPEAGRLQLSSLPEVQSQGSNMQPVLESSESNQKPLDMGFSFCLSDKSLINLSFTDSQESGNLEEAACRFAEDSVDTQKNVEDGKNETSFSEKDAASQDVFNLSDVCRDLNVGSSGDLLTENQLDPNCIGEEPVKSNFVPHNFEPVAPVVPEKVKSRSRKHGSKSKDSAAVPENVVQQFETTSQMLFSLEQNLESSKHEEDTKQPAVAETTNKQKSRSRSRSKSAKSKPKDSSVPSSGAADKLETAASEAALDIPDISSETMALSSPPSKPTSSRKKNPSKKSIRPEDILPESITFTESELSQVLDQVEHFGESFQPAVGNKKSRSRKSRSSVSSPEQKRARMETQPNDRSEEIAVNPFSSDAQDACSNYEGPKTDENILTDNPNCETPVRKKNERKRKPESKSKPKKETETKPSGRGDVFDFDTSGNEETFQIPRRRPSGKTAQATDSGFDAAQYFHDTTGVERKKEKPGDNEHESKTKPSAQHTNLPNVLTTQPLSQISPTKNIFDSIVNIFPGGMETPKLNSLAKPSSKSRVSCKSSPEEAKSASVCVSETDNLDLLSNMAVQMTDSLSAERLDREAQESAQMQQQTPMESECAVLDVQTERTLSQARHNTIASLAKQVTKPQHQRTSAIIENRSLQPVTTAQGSSISICPSSQSSTTTEQPSETKKQPELPPVPQTLPICGEASTLSPMDTSESNVLNTSMSEAGSDHTAVPQQNNTWSEPGQNSENKDCKKANDKKQEEFSKSSIDLNTPRPSPQKQPSDEGLPSSVLSPLGYSAESLFGPARPDAMNFNEKSSPPTSEAPVTNSIPKETVKLTTKQNPRNSHGSNAPNIRNFGQTNISAAKELFTPPSISTSSCAVQGRNQNSYNFSPPFNLPPPPLASNMPSTSQNTSLPFTCTSANTFSFTLSSGRNTTTTTASEYPNQLPSRQLPYYHMHPPPVSEQLGEGSTQTLHHPPPPLNLASFGGDASSGNSGDTSAMGRLHNAPSDMRSRQEKMNNHQGHSGPNYPEFMVNEPPGQQHSRRGPSFEGHSQTASMSHSEKTCSDSLRTSNRMNTPAQNRPCSRSNSVGRSPQIPGENAASQFFSPHSISSQSSSSSLTSPPLHHHGPPPPDSAVMRSSYGAHFPMGGQPYRNMPPFNAPTFDPPPLHFSRTNKRTQEGDPFHPTQNTAQNQKSSAQRHMEERSQKNLVAPTKSQNAQQSSHHNAAHHQQQQPAQAHPTKSSRPSKSAKKSSSKTQFDMESNVSNPMFDQSRITPYFGLGNLSPQPRNIPSDGPTYIGSNFFPNAGRPLSNTNPLQHKTPEISNPFMFPASRSQNGIGLNFQPGFGMNPMHGSHSSSSSQINPHSNSVSVTPHMTNFNLGNIFHENTSQGDGLNISPIKFPHSNPMLPPQAGMEHNALQHQGGPWVNRPQMHPPHMLPNAMSINSLLGHQHHGFEARPMAPGINGGMAPPFGGHGHPPSFGIPPLNFPMHDH